MAKNLSITKLVNDNLPVTSIYARMGMADDIKDLMHRAYKMGYAKGTRVAYAKVKKQNENHGSN